MNAILQVENLTKQYADFKLDHFPCTLILRNFKGEIL